MFKKEAKSSPDQDDKQKKSEDMNPKSHEEDKTDTEPVKKNEEEHVKNQEKDLANTAPKGYPPQPTNVTVIVPPEFGEKPAQVTCGNCRQTVVTTTTAENGACAYLACVIVLILCCPCFFIPLCMDSCKDIHHTCPGCGARLGTYKRL